MGYTVAKYLRLSIDDTKQESLSIENQHILLDSFISSMVEDDIEIMEFVDNGYSGTNFERPAVQELLELVRTGRVDCIVVKDFSRFGRNMIEAGYFLQMVFPLFHTRFIAVSDAYDSKDYEGDTGGVDIAFKLLIAEQYSRDLSRKIKSSKQSKALRGEFVTKNCIYGYKRVGNSLEIDKPAAKVVRRIFKMRENGCGLTDIAKYLYENKLPTPSEYKKKTDVPACIWNETTIKSILKEEQYIGTYIAGKTRKVDVGSKKVIKVDMSDWIRIPDHHPAIIDDAVFAYVNDSGNFRKEPLRKRKLGTSERYSPIKSVLRSKVFCGCCGHTMKQSSTRNIAYHCDYSIAASDMPCHRLRIADDDLTENVLTIIKQKADTIAEEAKKSPVMLMSDEDFEHTVDKYKNDKKALYESFINGDIDVMEYAEAKNAIDDAIRRLGIKSCTEQKELVERKNKRQAHELLKSAALENTLTREAVESLIDRVVVSPDGNVIVEWKLPDCNNK